MPDGILGSRTDARLIRAIAAVELAALAEAYDRHSQFVYGAGLRLCGQRQAEAMTQEVFLALWNSPTAFVKPEDRCAQRSSRTCNYAITLGSARGAVKGEGRMSTKIATLLAALLIAVGLPACADSGSEEGVGGDTGGGQEQESGTDDGGY